MDWNNDGKKDLLSGDSKGQVWFFKNIGSDAAPVLAEGVRMEADGQPIVGVSPEYKDGHFVIDPEKTIGIYSKINIADYNDDGRVDMLIGHTSPAGHDIVFYKNIGTKTEPKFGKPEPVKLPEPQISRPSPYLIDWDDDGVDDLLCGTERPAVYFFKNAGTNRNPKYQIGKKLPLNSKRFDDSYRCRIDVADWNNDGKLDLLVGNFYSNERPAGGNVWLFLAK